MPRGPCTAYSEQSDFFPVVFHSDESGLQARPLTWKILEVYVECFDQPLRPKTT